MPARERESIRFVLIPFSAPPFRHPGYLSLAHNPGGSRAAPTVVVSFHSPRSRLSPRSPPRGATSAPRLASLRKQSRTPGRPPAFTTTLRHLRLPTLARATASPPNTAVSRHRRAFSSSFFPASSSASRSSFLTPTYPSSPRPSRDCLPNHSTLSRLFSLCSPFLFVRRSPAFFCYSSLGNGLRLRSPSSHPSR